MPNPKGVPKALGSQKFGIGIFVDNSRAVPDVGAPQIKLAGIPVQQIARIQGPRVYYKALTIPLPPPVVAVTQVYGALTSYSAPAVRVALSLGMIAASGLTWVPPAPAVASVGWQQPLSKAVDRRPVQPGGPSYTFRDTAFTQNSADYSTYQQPLSRPAPRPPVWQGGPSYTFLDTQFTQNTVYWGNYQQPLSRAAPRPPVWAGFTFVPFNTAQIIFNTIDYSLYQQPLSIAVPIPRAAIGSTFVPFDTAQIVVAANYGWWQGLSQAAARPPVWQGGLSYTFLDTQFTQNTVYWGNYQQPLSRPADRPPVWQGGVSYTFLDTQFNTVYWGNYQQPLSRPANQPPVRQGITFVPFNTVQQIFNTVNSIAYLSPLSRAVPIPYTTFTVGYTFVPFNTVQVQPPPEAPHHDMPFFATFGQLKSW